MSQQRSSLFKTLTTATLISLTTITTMAYAGTIDIPPSPQNNYTVGIQDPNYGQPSPPPPGAYYNHHQNFGNNWFRFRGFIPAGAYPGGFENGRPLFICQAYYNNGLHPGKFVSGNCNITYAGHEIPQPPFRILMGNNYRWQRVYPGAIPANAVRGGYENGHPLYICRAHYLNGAHPGKVVGNSCNIGYAGREIVLNDYKVLVYGRFNRGYGN